MGDKVVDEVLATLDSVAFANRIDIWSLRPIVDVLVNALRNSGMDDEEIVKRLCPPTPGSAR